MRFSVILPSLLSDYPGASTGRIQKLARAVNSVLNQTFTDFELIVIADGCEITKYIIKSQFASHIIKGKIKLFMVERKELWSNTARNKGIESASGEYILYIDGDDFWDKDHLKIFNDNIHGEDWVWSNDWIYNAKESLWFEKNCDMEQYSHCGTSNICHASRLGLRWIKTGYGHDYHFIQELLLYKNYKQIPTAQYRVCHVAGWYCV
jgi:glycosyltransferase involved in cell wall biosynthesis